VYLPSAFNSPDIESLFELMRRHSLGALVTYDAKNGLEANHLPLRVTPLKTTQTKLITRLVELLESK
jgi:predicted FMN-binding regulatory protein PaiB